MEINKSVHEKSSSMIPSRLDAKQQVYMLMLARYIRFKYRYTRLVIFSANNKYADQCNHERTCNFILCYGIQNIVSLSELRGSISTYSISDFLGERAN